jgi:hypothetical protein
MSYEYKTLEENFRKLPVQFQEILTSPQIARDIKDIGEKNNLLIDQQSELFDLISHVVLGLTPAGDFIKLLRKNANITQPVAERVANDVNKTVFMRMRSQYVSEEDLDATDIRDKNIEKNINEVSSLERTGNFTIEKEIPSESGYGNNKNGVTYADRAKILADVEDPTPAKGVAPANLPTAGISSKSNSAPASNNSSENYSEPLVDYLTSNPIAQGEKEVVVNSKQQTPEKKPSIQTMQKSGPDPYREEIG